MHGFQGADVAQLRTAGHRFTASASDLQAMLAGLTQRIADPTYWRGADAERFRAEWESVSVPAVKAVVLGIHEVGTALLRHADEQEQASGGASASSPMPSTTGLAPGGSGISVSPHTLIGLSVVGLSLASNGADQLVSGIGYAIAGAELGSNIASGNMFGALDATATIGADLFKEAPVGTAPHLFGQAMGIWQFVGEQAGMTDRSAEGLETVADFVVSDPVGAMVGAGEGIVRGLPGILGAVL